MVDPTPVVPGTLAVERAGGIGVAGLKIKLAVYRSILASEIHTPVYVGEEAELVVFEAEEDETVLEHASAPVVVPVYVGSGIV